jgi:Ankyrin repeats (many copies)
MFLLLAKHQGANAKRRVHDAVKSGDMKELELMIKDGASVNEVDSTKDHFTPVHWACYAGTLEVRNLQCLFASTIV